MKKMKKSLLTIVMAMVGMLAMANPVKYDLKGQFPAALNGKKVVVYAIGNECHRQRPHTRGLYCGEGR